MKHKEYKELLQLSFYNELDDQSKQLLENHLMGCADCSEESKRIKKMHSILAQNKPAPVTEKQLNDARRELRKAIAEELSRVSWWESIVGVFDDIFGTHAQVVLGSLSMLAVGVFVGYIVFKSSAASMIGLQTASIEDKYAQGQAQMTNIHLVDRDEKTGDVEIAFDAVAPVRVRGKMNDDRIQKILAQAMMSEQNPGTRLRAINMIGNQIESKDQQNNTMNVEVKNALITTVKYDQNLGVRKQALEVLRQFLPDTAVMRAFLFILANEKNTGLKIAAINSLDVTQYENRPINSELRRVLQHKVQSDENNYIRIRANAALQEDKQ